MPFQKTAQKTKILPIFIVLSSKQTCARFRAVPYGVIVTGCALFVTSQYDVIFTFPN